MGVALEEPREDDTSFVIDGVPFAGPPDTGRILRVYDEAVLDHDPHSGRASEFFVRLGRRSWSA